MYISDKYASTKGTIASKKMLDAAGVKQRSLTPATDEIVLSFRTEDM